MPDGGSKVLVAIADVDAVVNKGSALDDHARQTTTSVYAVAETFPMLREKLSTDLAPLNCDSDRLAVAVEWFSPGMDRFRRRTSLERWCAIVQSVPTMALPPGWRVTGRCHERSARSSGLDESPRHQDRAVGRQVIDWQHRLEQ